MYCDNNIILLLAFSAVCVIGSTIIKRACVGEVVTLTCVNAHDQSTTTVWQGTAFDCPSGNSQDEISFLNTDFDSSVTKSWHCTDNDHSVIIVAQAVSVEHSVYLTQLNFTATALLHREVTIQCDYDDGIRSGIITNYSILVEDCNTVSVTLSTIETNEASSTTDMITENIMTNDTTNIEGDV